MQKETKEMLCATAISFLSGVVITLIVFGCATHMGRMQNKHMYKCPYSQEMNHFKHHNKLMGRKEPPALVVPVQPQSNPRPNP